MVVSQGEAVIRVEDSAPAFNPLQAAAPNLNLPLELKQPGGLGIHLVRKVMDALDYEFIGDKNRLTLRKRL
jgi:anti-sigma regulatory factor (Ser/Thr protein kinase)